MTNETLWNKIELEKSVLADVVKRHGLDSAEASTQEAVLDELVVQHLRFFVENQ